MWRKLQRTLYKYSCTQWICFHTPFSFHALQQNVMCNARLASAIWEMDLVYSAILDTLSILWASANNIVSIENLHLVPCFPFSFLSFIFFFLSFIQNVEHGKNMQTPKLLLMYIFKDLHNFTDKKQSECAHMHKYIKHISLWIPQCAGFKPK